MSDEYEQVARGKLKLKSDSSKISKKSKKKEKKNREKMEREAYEYNEQMKNSQQEPVRQFTKAELSFKKMQEKMVCSATTRLKRAKKPNTFLNGIVCLFFSARKTNHGESIAHAQTTSGEIQ